MPSLECKYKTVPETVELVSSERLRNLKEKGSQRWPALEEIKKTYLFD